MIYFERKNQNSEIIFSNISECKNSEGYEYKEIPLRNGSIFLFTNLPILIKRSKIFRLVREICSPVLDSIINDIDEKSIELIKAHSHTLKKLQGQMTQKIEEIIDNPMLIASQDFNEQREVVSCRIIKNPSEAAEILIYLKKRISEVEAHISSFQIIHMGKDIYLDFHHTNIRRLILSVMSAFQDSLDEKHIKIIFKFEDDFAERDKIKLDFKTIHTALYNFFDNVIKYTKPYSEVRFYFDIDVEKKFTIDTTMKSLRIEHDECIKIFELGYRGKNTTKVDGCGVGMFVFKKALELNRLKIIVVPDYSNMELYNNQQYILNKFIISGYV